MRKYFFYIVFFFLFNLSFSQIKKENNIVLFKEFSFEQWEINYPNYKKGKKYNTLYYKGTDFFPDYSFGKLYIYIYPQKKQFYTIYNEYFFNLKQKTPVKIVGKTFGWDMFLQTEMKIGWWYEYDESGKIIKKTDEDTKFGVFGYNELLKSLDNNKIINLKKGVEYVDGGKWNIRIQFFYTPTSTKKLWKVTLQTESVNDRTEFGKDFIKVYYFDGNTGERISRMIDEVDYYKEIGFHL
ncbi:hypothetical protein V3Q90_11755 [Flavobacterium oreochromis]|uniref:hypothetical protein n=1 Tax=Flavobacterium oreochromis TaxID=2906078 RepID=UPI000CDAC836|nr:hypothetical protein BWK58_07930 [Flavobacterium columnare]